MKTVFTVSSKPKMQIRSTCSFFSRQTSWLAHRNKKILFKKLFVFFFLRLDLCVVLAVQELAR